jgi:predicted nucleic acid-binding protein
MKDKVFIDTNVLLYAIDCSASMASKRDAARRIIREQISGESGVISVQVLQEFFAASTSKIQQPISADEALEFLHFISVMETVAPDFPMVVSAVRLHRRCSLPFWDAMIVQAAMAANCKVLLSEDMQDGLQIDSFTIRNPFCL